MRGTARGVPGDAPIAPRACRGRTLKKSSDPKGSAGLLLRRPVLHSAGAPADCPVFGFLKRKKKPAKPKDPLAVYDGFIESLERQGAEVRKSAATLLALKGELTRDLEKYGTRAADLERRVFTAEGKGDARAAKTLRRDLEEAREMKEQSEKALDSANEDARLLIEAAEENAKKVSELKSERQSARARLATGVVVSSALKQQVEQFDRVMQLDAARDEVERARALADIYREDTERKRERLR